MRKLTVLALPVLLGTDAWAEPAKPQPTAPKSVTKAKTTGPSTKEKDTWVFDRRIPSKGPIRKSEIPSLLKKMNHPDSR